MTLSYRYRTVSPSLVKLAKCFNFHNRMLVLPVLQGKHRDFCQVWDREFLPSHLSLGLQGSHVPGPNRIKFSERILKLGCPTELLPEFLLGWHEVLPKPGSLRIYLSAAVWRMGRRGKSEAGNTPCFIITGLALHRPVKNFLRKALEKKKSTVV